VAHTRGAIKQFLAQFEGGAAYYTAGVDLPTERDGEPIRANQPDGRSDQAYQMPQVRFLGGGEVSRYPSRPTHLSDTVDRLRRGSYCATDRGGVAC
jgi:hypothetical protein